MHMGSQAGRYVKIDMLEGKFASQQIDFYESWIHDWHDWRNLVPRYATQERYMYIYMCSIYIYVCVYVYTNFALFLSLAILCVTHIQTKHEI